MALSSLLRREAPCPHLQNENIGSNLNKIVGAHYVFITVVLKMVSRKVLKGACSTPGPLGSSLDQDKGLLKGRGRGASQSVR